jgi:hypothetical protein
LGKGRENRKPAAGKEKDTSEKFRKIASYVFLI